MSINSADEREGYIQHVSLPPLHKASNPPDALLALRFQLTIYSEKKKKVCISELALKVKVSRIQITHHMLIQLDVGPRTCDV